MPKSQNTKTGDIFQIRLMELENERKKAIESKGLKQFFSFPVGETVVQFNTEVQPRQTQNGRWAYRGSVNGIEYDIPLSPLLERQVLKHLVNGHTTLKIVRAGTGRTDTRYSVIPL